MSKVIHNFNRFELKYILTLEQVEELKKDLIKYVIPDSHGKWWKYTLSSLYYDTHDYRFYWEKIEGLKFRKKIRIRRYVTDDKFDENSLVYVEIKQRIDRVTQKRRVWMTYKEAKLLLEEEIIPQNYREEDKEVIEELLAMVKKDNLRPAAITIYNREAFFGTENDIWLRITFDTDVSYKQKDLDLIDAQPEWHMIPPNYCILEIKADDKIPYWVTELAANHGIRLIRVSKYCQALETAWLFPESVFNINGQLNNINS